MPIVQSSFSSMSAGAAEVLNTFDAGKNATQRDITARVVDAVAAPGAAAAASFVAPRSRIASDVTTEVDTSSGDANNPTEAPVSWEEVKATTWVNVRADRSRDASIVAVLNPDDIVRLGARESGWRQVNVDGATGWVDGRHFTSSARQ
jgi:hypothetical protein